MRAQPAYWQPAAMHFKTTCFDFGECGLCSIDTHPRLLDEEVHDAGRPVNTRPYHTNHDESTERVLHLLGNEVKKGGQAHEDDAPMRV